MVELFANSVDPYQTPRYTASDLGLHCLPVIPLGVSSLQWVKRTKKATQRTTIMARMNTLRKHAYSNIMKILPRKNENFQIKISDIFHISARNIDCVTQSMFLSRNKENNVYPYKLQFYYIKWG